jgi:predicted DNA-binding ribbon-helix-helix protein
MKVGPHRDRSYHLSEPSVRRKTENRSFRIESAVLQGLEEEARRKKVSVNTFVNQLLANYIDVGRHRLRVGTVSLSTSAFKLLINELSDEYLMKAGKESGKSIPRAYASSKWGQDSTPNLLSFIRDNASITGLYDYSESSSTPRSITLTHPYGRKWSIFLSSFFLAAFEDTGPRPQTEISDQAVVIKMP